MFWQDLDPGYYQNPAAYTYLVYAVLRVMYGPLGFVFDLPFGNVTDQFDKNPTEIWIAARTAGRGALHGRRGGDLLGGPAAVGNPRGAGGGGPARVRVPAGGVLARGGHRRGSADRGGAVAGLRGARLRARAPCRRFAPGRRGRRARGLVQVHGRPRAAAGRDRGDRDRRAAADRGRRARGRRARRLRAAAASRGRRVRRAQPVPVRLARRLVERPSRPGRGGARPAEAGPGVGRRLLLPRQPHLGPRMGRRVRRARRRRRSSSVAISCAA